MSTQNGGGNIFGQGSKPFDYFGGHSQKVIASSAFWAAAAPVSWTPSVVPGNFGGVYPVQINGVPTSTGNSYFTNTK